MEDKRKYYRSVRPFQHIQLKPLLKLMEKEIMGEDLKEMFEELTLRLD